MDKLLFILGSSLLVWGVNATPIGKSFDGPDSSEVLPWWKTSVIYQIYPRSFKDSNGSGTGDLKGITSKADYLKDIGVGAVWISPIYVSPMADFGYDIANFIDIDPIFGTLADFDELQTELNARGIQIIMDFVPNHSSDKHDWFQKSIKKIDPYTDYYVWRAPKGFNGTGHPIPPSNWVSVFRYSAWEWNEERQEFYLHQFLKEQPDLNVRNPAVMDELDNIIKFWFDRGVGGFRIDALMNLFEVMDMSLDEPVDEDSGFTDPTEYGYLDHIYTKDQPETIDAVRRWRQIAEQYKNRFLIAEVFDPNPEFVMRYYSKGDDLIAHLPFNFYFISDLQNRSFVTGENLKKLIARWVDNMPEGGWPNWVLGSHDRRRVASRLGTDLIDAMNMLSLLLPGTPTTYYGEEIGMEDIYVSFEQVKDPRGYNFGPERYEEFGRDPERSPMQWDDTHNAGFSNASETWLPVNENYLTINVASERTAPESHLKVYQSLTKLRQKKSFTHGDCEYALVSPDVLAFVRHLEGDDSYLVILNTSTRNTNIDLSTDSSYGDLPAEGTVVIRSSSDTREETVPGSIVALNEVSLLPGEGLVLKL